MLRRGQASRRWGDRGAAAVEFALLLPFLAILVCGTIDLGRWYSAWNETKNAAREGALYAQGYPEQQRSYGGDCANPNNIEARARQELSANASDPTFVVTISPAILQCNPDPSQVPVGTTMTVTVSRKVGLITPLIRNLVGDVSITAKVTATVQG
jgi:Flp pilus assembly protein TadG